MGIKKKHTPGCGCCGPPCITTATAASCTDSRAPVEISVIIGSVTNAVCTDCGNCNGTFVCTYTGEFGGFSRWESASFTLCGTAGGGVVRVEIDANDIWVIVRETTFTQMVRFKKTTHDTLCTTWSGLNIPLFDHNGIPCNSSIATCNITSAACV